MNLIKAKNPLFQMFYTQIWIYFLELEDGAIDGGLFYWEGKLAVDGLDLAEAVGGQDVDYCAGVKVLG